MTRSERIQVAALTLLALACRAPLAYGSGIWADEGMALNVVAIPSIGGMLDFLRLHESHPPLFYLMLRVWRAVAGTSDVAAFSLMLMIAVLIVPATYAISRSFVSRRASFIASLLVALSPALAEHSTQIRPYGLLPLVVLTSCYLLVRCLEDGGWKRWSAYVLVTATALYTHNWAWLVLGGQVVAVVTAVVTLHSATRKAAAMSFGVALIGIGLLFLPWLPALLIQTGQAGHAGVHVGQASDLLAFYLFALVSIPDYLLLGLYPRSSLSLVLLAGAVAVVSVSLIALAPNIADRALRSRRSEDAPATRSQTFLLVFLLAPAVAIATAVVMSPWSALFIQRCLAMLTPVVLVAMVAVIDRIPAGTGNVRGAALGIGMLSFVVALEVAGIVALMPTSRSNAKEVAESLRTNMLPGDLLIVSPEWFAPSFNHYFPPSIEQHDHPQTGRSGLIDFSGPQRRFVDSAATRRLTRLVADARGSGRRVWLVSERTYLRYVDEVLPTLTSDAQRARYAPVRRVKEARDLLIDSYGQADTTHFVHGRVSRYEELLPLLFQPKPASGKGF